MTDKLSPSALTSGTLSINPLFPYYGQDNPSQGFRDNFRNTLVGLTSAYDTINSLIDNELLKGVDNSTSMDHGEISEVILANWSQSRVRHVNSGTTITLNYDDAVVHYIENTTASNITLAIRGLPTDSTFGAMRVYVDIPDTNLKVFWEDSAYFLNGDKLGGYTPSTGAMTFLSSGTFGIEVATFTGSGFFLRDLDNRATSPTGISGGGGVRTTLTTSTPVLSVGNSANLDLAGFKGYALYAAEISSPAWVRVYTDTGARNDDLLTGRPQTADPSTPGVVAEFVTSVSNERVKVSPAVIGFNDEPVPVAKIPLAITNIGTTQQSIQVKLIVVQTES